MKLGPSRTLLRLCARVKPQSLTTVEPKIVLILVDRRQAMHDLHYCSADFCPCGVSSDRTHHADRIFLDTYYLPSVVSLIKDNLMFVM
jgi:hypothetical protein